MIKISIKKSLFLFVVCFLNNLSFLNAMQLENELPQQNSSFIKSHPIISSCAATIAIGTASYYWYRNNLIKSYKQALLTQQKENKEIKKLPEGILYPVQKGVIAIATDSSNNYLVCGLIDGSLQLRNFETLEIYQETEPFNDHRSQKYTIRTLSTHPHKPVCAVAYGHGKNYEGAIGIYSINDDKTLTLLKVLYGVSRSVTGLTFNHNGSLLASISDREGSSKLSPAEDTVKLWNTKDWTCIGSLVGHINDGLKVSFSANGKLLASSGYQEAKIWDVENQTCIKTFSDEIGYRISTGYNYGGNNIFIAAFHPKETNLLAIGDKNSVKLIDISNDIIIQKFVDPTNFDYLPSEITFDKKGKKIAIRYEDRENFRNSYLSWYDVKSGQQLGHLKINDNSGHWGNIIFDKKSENVITGFCMNDRLYDAYIENPITATILEKVGSPVFHVDLGRIGKFNCSLN